MIVPMKKVAVITQSKDAESALRKLRALGVLHVEHQKPPKGEDINSLRDELAIIERAINILSPIKIPKSASEGIKPPEELSRLARHVVDLSKRLDYLETYSRNLKAMIDEWETWGDFDPQAVERLKEKNIYVRLCRIPRISFLKDMPEGVIVKKISTVGKMINCVIVSHGLVDMPFKELSLPKKSLKDMRLKLAENDDVMRKIREDIKKEASFPKNLERARKALEKDLEFCQALRGIGERENIIFLTGYIPYGEVGKILGAAREEKWGIAIDEPSEGGVVPTLIKNPRWISIINPIFKMLEIVPGYRELDISLSFLIFFSIFFGILIGDAGYGIIYACLTFVAQRAWSGKLKDQSAFILFYLLSFSAVLWGVLTGTFFGQGWLPESFKGLVPALRDPKTVQTLCFFLGALQLSVAHLWRSIIKIPSIKALADFGWIMVLWGAFFLAKTLILGDAFPEFAKWLFVAGPFFVVCFTKPERNLLKGIAAGFGNLLLNFINNFTDVVSYIRLFAVGLATVAVADSFNKMAAELGYGSILTGLAASSIILLGHLLNVMLGPLAILVHGVRLNVLEFANHLDIKWSGFKYRPLREEADK